MAASSLVAAILVLALLYFASSVFIPLFFALLLIAIAWPIQESLQRRMPTLLALLITLSLMVFVIMVIGSAIAWGFGLIGQWLFLNAGRLQTIYLDWTSWLDDHGIALAGPIADRFNVAWLVGLVQTIVLRMNSMTGTAVLVFIYVMLGLLEAGDFNRRLLAPRARPIGEKILRANREIGAKLRRFMLVRTVASVVTGLIVWVFALAAGLELAAAWGAIAFALNYIPFLGPFVATAFPTLFAIAQFESWQMAVVICGCLTLIQFIIGSYLEPRLTGASLAISPFAVMFGVFFWSFMWGLPGAFIGVPILIAFVIYCRQSRSAGWISELLSRGEIIADDRA